jgi:hypothetical protein
MAKYEVPLENPTGVILQTENKYCDGIIVVKPKLQTKTVSPSEGSVRADDGYCGLLEVIISGATRVAVTQKVVELSGTSGEFSISDYADILTNTNIAVDGVVFTYLGGDDENKCYAAYDVASSTLKVVKTTGKAWVLTAYTV